MCASCMQFDRVCLCLCVCMYVCLTGKIVYRGRKMSAVRSGSSREYNNDNRAVWSLPDSSAKSYTKEEESRQPRKTPKENSFLQKDGSPADGFLPSWAGSWISKTNANSPSIKCCFEQVFQHQNIIRMGDKKDAQSHVLDALTK